MKSKIERRHHRRAAKMLGRLVGPLTLSLLFAAYSSPAHADTITVVGTPGTPGVDASGPAPPTSGGGRRKRRRKNATKWRPN